LAQYTLHRDYTLNKEFPEVPDSTEYLRYGDRIKTGLVSKNERYYQYGDSIRIYCSASDTITNLLLTSGLIHPYLIYRGRPKKGYKEYLKDVHGRPMKYITWRERASKYWIYIAGVGRGDQLNAPSSRKRFYMWFNPGNQQFGYNHDVAIFQVDGLEEKIGEALRTFLERSTLTYFRIVCCFG
jgi:hypothetical protein